MTEPPRLVVPLGHLHGTFHGGGQHTDVRLGGALHRLTADEFTAWWLARGVPDRLDEPWTADAMTKAAGDFDLPDMTVPLARLRQKGLVAEVTQGTQDAVEFARRYRTLPLLLGLGNTADDPGSYQIGLFGQPVIALPAALYDLWQWAVIDINLWNACRGAAELAVRAEVESGQATDPEELLNAFLDVLHPLLSAQALYLDVWRGAPVEAPRGR